MQSPRAMKPDPKRQPSLMSGFGQAMGLSGELVVTTAVGAALGWLIDKGLHTKLVFLMVGSLLGGAAGIVRLYRTWMRKK